MQNTKCKMSKTTKNLSQERYNEDNLIQLLRSCDLSFLEYLNVNWKVEIIKEILEHVLSQLVEDKIKIISKITEYMTWPRACGNEL